MKLTKFWSAKNIYNHVVFTWMKWKSEKKKKWEFKWNLTFSSDGKHAVLYKKISSDSLY